MKEYENLEDNKNLEMADEVLPELAEDKEQYDKWDSTIGKISIAIIVSVGLITFIKVLMWSKIILVSSLSAVVSVMIVGLLLEPFASMFIKKKSQLNAMAIGALKGVAIGLALIGIPALLLTTQIIFIGQTPGSPNMEYEESRFKTSIQEDNKIKLDDFEYFLNTNEDYIKNIVGKAGNFVYPTNFVSRLSRYDEGYSYVPEKIMITYFEIEYEGIEDILDEDAKSSLLRIQELYKEKGLYIHYVENEDIDTSLRSSVKEIELFKDLEDSEEINYSNYLVILNYP